MSNLKTLLLNYYALSNNVPTTFSIPESDCLLVVGQSELN